MKQFEYKVVNLFEEGSWLEQRLNSYGEEGWELISKNVRDSNYAYVFKREKQVKQNNYGKNRL